MRPICWRCLSQQADRVYIDPIDGHHTTLLKRKYDRLEEQSKDEHQILRLTRSACEADSLQILGCLRAGDDTQSVIDFAHDLALSWGTLHDTNLQDQSGGNRGLLLTLYYTSSTATVNASPSNTGVPVTERSGKRLCASMTRVDNVSLPSVHTLLYVTQHFDRHLSTGLICARPSIHSSTPLSPSRL